MTPPLDRPHPLLDRNLLLRGLVLIATLTVIGLLLQGLGLKSMVGTGWIDSHVRGHGLAGTEIGRASCRERVLRLV